MQCCTIWTVLCGAMRTTCFWTMAEGLADTLTSTSSCRMLLFGILHSLPHLAFMTPLLEKASPASSSSAQSATSSWKISEAHDRGSRSLQVQLHHPASTACAVCACLFLEQYSVLDPSSTVDRAHSAALGERSDLGVVLKPTSSQDNKDPKP